MFAQVKMPEMPSITNISDGPSMPHVSAPTMGTQFYVPGNIYNKRKNEQTVAKTDDTTETSVTAAKKTENIASQLNSLLSGENSRLTARDVSELGTSGLFGGIYGLFGNEGAYSTENYTATASTDVLLQKIMAQLEDLKSLNSQNLKENNEEKSYLTTAQLSSLKEEHEPKILRFYVNGYNVLDTCRTVYFSKKELDGSFLLTGDRKYNSDNKTRDETFYLLFRANGDCGTAAGYNVEPKVVQDYKNEYSFLYQMAQKHNLKAEKTGNLVSLRSTEPDWNMDLLLDIGE